MTGSGTINGCVKALRLSYVLRNDGHVLVEQRDKSKEGTILGPDAKAFTGAIDVAGGYYHGCALTSDGTVWCWREGSGSDRSNAFGQLGNGATDHDTTAPIERASQVLVAAGQPLANVQALAQGSWAGLHTCAITKDGKLYCWGDLTWLIGAGTAVSSPYAQTITVDGFSPLAGVLEASISPTMACAIVSGSPNNALYCWGGNSHWNLGTGDTNNRPYPTRVTTVMSPKKVAVYAYSYLSTGGSACAVDGDGVVCWGLNINGVTGAGKTDGTTNSPTPVVIGDGTTPLPKAVDISSATIGAFCALETNQTLWCWGSGFKATASNYGLTNVSLLGGLAPVNSYVANVLFLTTDGAYHWGMEWSRSPVCTP